MKWAREAHCIHAEVGKTPPYSIRCRKLGGEIGGYNAVWEMCTKCMWREKQEADTSGNQ